MKRQLLLSFLLFLIMAVIMRWQGASLIKETAPAGILNLEFAKTSLKLFQLKLIWKESDLKTNIYLDVLFILSYTWFLVIACLFIKYRMRWKRYARIFIYSSLAAGLLDLCENALMLSAWYDPSNIFLIKAVYFCALLKFLLIGLVVLFLLTGISTGYYQKHFASVRSEL